LQPVNEAGGTKQAITKAAVNCTPIVRQYGILNNDWGVFMPKGVPNKRYTAEFKQKVVEAVLNEGLSYEEARRIYEVNGRDRIQSWERIYLAEGPEGLAVERRGRGSTGRPKKLPQAVEEDLLAEVQRLRAEVAYLKNLQALVLEEERRQRRKRR
jgi:transposase-like protein